MIKYAIIGLGFIFPRHKEAIEKTGGEIVLTCDNDPDKKADFLDYKEMFDSPRFSEVDYVVVLLPNYLHSLVSREALKRGKKVLCEKPLTIFEDFKGLEEVNTVMQLRYNPRIKYINGGNIDIFVKTYREPAYFESWKGQEALSGGILHNMGVHYIDLLCHLLGPAVEIKKSHYTPKLAYGEVLFKKGKGTYYIELSTEPCPVIRKINVNGVSTDLEGATIPFKNPEKVKNLHIKVYEEMLKGKGMKLNQAKKSLKLIEKLKDFAQ